MVKNNRKKIMKKYKNRIINGLLYLSIALLCIGCTKKDEVLEIEKKIDVVKQEEVKEMELEKNVEENLGNQNLLTGIKDLSDEAIGKRPVAVMINNVEDALPQYGVAQADVIFEIPVEADLTRMMALYGDYTKVPQICSVRSCRKYFPAFSTGFDAVYVHWGMDSSILEYVNSLDLTRYDGMANTGGLYGRDQDRLNSGYSLEHTSYFDGTKLPETMEQRGERTDLKDEKKGSAFLFNGVDEQIKPEGEECLKVNVNFGKVLATLTYDASTNTYLKDINGNAQVDGKTGTQLAFTNVFVLETSIGIDSINGVHKLVDWKGSEESVGYYISNGVVQKIHWSKASEEDYLKFYNEEGQELSINRGKSYIAVNYAGQTIFE